VDLFDHVVLKGGRTQASQTPLLIAPENLSRAYEKCGVVTGEYAKTFYLVRQAHQPIG
jgi:hypothetical protein